MAKDYFQDIVPQPNDDSSETPGIAEREAADDAPREVPISRQLNADVPASPASGMERSIRNISAPVRQKPRMEPRETRPLPREGAPHASRWWLWAIAGISLVVLAALLLVSLRDTRVTVIPRSHSITFDTNTEYAAFPALDAATDTLSYTVESFDVEDSEVVPSQGTVRVEEKASGQIIVFNESSTNPVRLIKNTRFETPDGLIFRTPSDVSVPGMRGTTPGQTQITVIADQPGESYNVGAIGKFTLPGLAGSAEFTSIYARSSAPMTGGFVGDRPGIAPADLQTAMAAVRTRLAEKAREQAIVIAGSDNIALPELMEVTYQDLPQTAEAGGGARVHQRAIVRIPVFRARDFAATIARGVSADAEGATVRLVPQSGFGARALATSTALGVEPVIFTMTGSALLVWDVDTEALAAALAGKGQDAFEAIVDAFPGVQEAKARIQPMWKKSFPTDTTKIRIEVEDPAKSA